MFDFIILNGLYLRIANHVTQGATFSLFFFILITLAVKLLLLQSSNLNTYLHHNGSTLGEENKNIKKGANKVSSEPKNILDFVKLLALNN